MIKTLINWLLIFNLTLWEHNARGETKMDKKNLSIIDKELTVEGSISSSGKLIIKGKVRGEIKNQ